ncbi:MAG: response regulator [Geminicoccaceae bacterium]|nr:MAG: response regulator [Geminicoccaceae bacterium]
MDELLSEFLTESFENLAMLDVELVRLEQNPNDPDLLSSIFRTAHTIKGTCGFLGLPRLERVAHSAENVLGRVRDGEIALTPAAVTLVLQALDRIKFILDQLEATEAEPPGDDAELIDALNRAADGDMPETQTPPPAETATAPAAVATMAAEPESDPMMEGEPALLKPSDAALEAAAAAVDEPGVVGERSGSSVAAQSLRVSVDLLEDLMTLVSELVLTRNQLLQMVRNEGESRFKGPLQRLSQITSELQEGVMKTRMQPIGNAWSKLPRLIRDLSLDLGKRIELKMLGADTELDRQVLDLIKDPLTHMVRNSADHGIETVMERKAAGKVEHGTITLNAYHEGGQIIIEIADDGKGLDVQRIGQKALEQGIVDAAELESMPPNQVMQFIFKAGFSTATTVTSVSGRGVGMDVVRTNIEKIGGHVDLSSEKGRGTKLTIKIPLTLAIVSALIVEAGAERFAIPQIGVVELVRAGQQSEHKIEIIDDAPILRLRDRLLPLVRLTTLLGLTNDAGLEHYEQAYVVVSQVGNSRVGLVVDKVFDTEEIVVKPVSPILRGVGCFSGNTILGDGSVVMILDLNSLTGSLNSASTEAGEPLDTQQQRGTESTSLLLFRASDRTPRAVPLGLVTRLEEIDLGELEESCGRAVLQYRGQLMPLTDIHGSTSLQGEGKRPALVFTDSNHNMGLVVDEIIDIANDVIDVKVASNAVGTIGSAVIAGRSTDIIDVAHFVQSVFGGWFAERESEPYRADEVPRTRRVLIVDDSSFFRNLLGPILSANGYDVVKVDRATKALELRDRGELFDAVISDIEMPEMDGFTFAKTLRQGGAWADLPVIALSSHTTEQDLQRGRDAGFTDYVGKLDREALLAAISHSLELQEALA